jgi:predicted ATPase/DNA-binding SARP family transcriptional activator
MRHAEGGETVSEEERPASPLAIALFGSFEVRLPGCPLPRLRSQKSQWLLALLALQHGRAVERAWLSGVLWPDSTGRQAAYNLSRNLTDLRHLLGPEARRLEAPTTQTLRLDLVGVEADVLLFDEAIARGDPPSLEQAIALHRGPLLQGCGEEWVLQEREAREEAYLGALETLAAHAMTQGEHTTAVRTLRRLVVADPLRDSAQRALMQALAAAGDAAAVTQVYRDFRLRLHRELNAAPDPETTALYQQLRAGSRRKAGLVAGCPAPDNADGSPRAVTADLSPGPAPSAQHGRFPRPLTRLVGREKDLREIRARLADAPLVTVTGPGGIGKTRLAIQVAEECRSELADGVWFVDLARLSDPALVPQAVASAFAVPEQPDRPLTETLQEFLRSRQLLLILDNCEHLLRACAELVEALLSGCPELRILATSRQSLGLTGEIAWQLPGLSVPQTQALECRVPTPGALMQFEAVRLFVERAMGATSAFALTGRGAPSVVQICRRLEGMPLAIELAAARVKALSVEEIAARLDDRFRLLTGGSRTALPRQQTLRATMDWSYELLAEPERALLRRLSVFAGGFTLEAAEWVCGADRAVFSPRRHGGHGGVHGERHEASPPCTPPCPPCLRGEPNLSASAVPEVEQEAPSADVLDLLTQLIDQSLVWAEERGGDVRYRLLETTRAYAGEKLAASGEAAGVRRRHRDWYLQLVEHAAPELQGPQQGLWLERLDAEHDNLRAALEWSLEDAPDQALRLAGTLAHFWEARSHLEEGRRRLAEALERAGRWRRSPIGAAALDGAGVLVLHQGDYAAAHALYGESLEIRRQLGDQRGMARSLGHLGRLALDQGELSTARALLEESLAIERKLDGRGGLATTLADLAFVAYHQGEFEAARALLEESLAIARERGAHAHIATALAGLAEIACRQEEYALARSFGEEALALRRALGDRCGVAECLGVLGNIAIWQAEYAAARSHLEEALAIGRERADRPAVADILSLLGKLAQHQNDYPAARRFREESLAIWRALGSRMAVLHGLGALGHLAREQGDFGQARAFYAESLCLRQEAQDTISLIAALEDFAELAAAEGQWARVTRLLGAALARREAAGKPVLPCDRAAWDRWITDARGALTEAAFAAAWAEGQALTLEEAAGYALQGGDTAASEAEGQPHADPRTGRSNINVPFPPAPP